jgi:hypothetical protein
MEVMRILPAMFAALFEGLDWRLVLARTREASAACRLIAT